MRVFGTRATCGPRRPRGAGLATGLAILALTAAACGGTSSGSSSSSSSGPAQTAGSTAGSGGVSTQFVTVSSSRSFAATTGALKKSVSKAGMMVLGNLNQAKALSMTGLKLPGAQAFFVGNPTTGKMFFQTNPGIGSVVPLRMYVWATKGGKAEIGYFDPAPLFKAVDPKLASGGTKMSMMANKIAHGASS